MSRRAVAMVPVALVLAGGCGAGSTDAVVVMAPSSLTDVVDDLDDALADIDLEPVIAGSSTLVAQLRAGADADVLVTADRATMDAAVTDGTVAGRPTLVTRNSLVIALAPGNPGRVTGVADLGRADLVVGVCAPEVPCGALAATASDAIGFEIAADTEEANVRSLATKISLAEVDVGLVYRTDAAELGLETVSADELSGFTTDYLIALVDDDPDLDTETVIAALTGPDGAAVLAAHGFPPPAG